VREIRDAASVIVAREEGDEGPEVFLVRRSARSVFLPDLYVFPGGAVDVEDADGARTLMCGNAGDVDPAFAFAAIRETFEEVALLFADRPVDAQRLAAARAAIHCGETFAAVVRDLGVLADASQLRYFSRWITPPSEVRRFDARFFVARAPRDQVAEADAFEVHDGRWMRPRAALTAYENGEIGLIFPTIKHLERIAPYRSVDDLLAFAATKTIATVAPTVSGDRLFSIDPDLEAAW
jgi:8-oxo-dGTP pyrophosphatase MutT (NUDIX family)